jgi:hypothetical protein
VQSQETTMVLSVAMRPSNEALLKAVLLLKQGGLRVEEVALRREGDLLTGRIVVTGKEAKARWFVEKARTLPFFVSADLGA